MAVVLRGGVVWDGLAAEPAPADVVVVDTVVTDVRPPGSVVATDDDLTVELDGAFVLPGLLDSHVHLVWSGAPDPVRVVDDEGEQLTVVRAVVHARQQLAAGVTTVRDLGSNWDVAVTVAKAVDRGICEGPTIVASGRTVIMTGGHDPFWGIFSDGVDAVTRAVRGQVHLGAGVIKTAATGGAYGQSEGEEVGQSELSYEELAAIAAEAHRFGRRVAAHALGTEGIDNAVRAGIDTIEHGVFLTEEIVAEMGRRGTVLCPTLATYRALAEGAEPKASGGLGGVGWELPAYAREKARQVIEGHRESFAMALDAGVPVIAGTDAGAPYLGHPSLVAELEVMHDYGLPLVDTLRAATSGAARAIDRPPGTGTITPGAPADLLIAEKNPFEDLANLRAVWGVLRSGQICGQPHPTSPPR